MRNLTFFTPRNARIASTVLATAILSVCLSVTRCYCVKTTERSTVQFALSDSKMCLVLLYDSANCTVLRAVVLTQYRRVTDGRTDRRNCRSQYSACNASIASAVKTIVFGSRPSDHYFRSVCWFVCLLVCAEFFSAVFDPILIKLGRMLCICVP